MAEAHSWRNKLLLAKLETTYGASSAPSVATNVILGEEVTITPIEGTEVQRVLDHGPASRTLTYLVGKHVTLSIKVGLVGSGTLGVPPHYAPLLRSCQMAETIVADESCTYTRIRTGTESCTIKILIDGITQTVRGCRGTWNIDISVPAVPTITFSMLGLFEAPTLEAPPGVIPGGLDYPEPETTSATSTDCVLGGAGLQMTQATISSGSAAQYYETSGRAQVRCLADDTSTITITAEADISTNNWVASAATSASTKVPFVMSHGTGPLRFAITSPRARVGKVTWVSLPSDVAGMQIPLICERDATEAALSITFAAA
ncbi:hypothetical protein [Tistrella sp.]|nr:hypothetical protein [Tistrella sp.]MAD39574.1 hypothetical protein [Tistrella sp.]